MALEFAKRTPYAVAARYHRLSEVSFHYGFRKAAVTLQSFATADARTANAEPLTTELFTIEFERLGGEEPTRKQIYDALKGLDQFRDAVDV